MQTDTNYRSSRLMLGPALGPLCYPLPGLSLPALGPHLPLSRLTLSQNVSQRDSLSPAHADQAPRIIRRLSDFF